MLAFLLAIGWLSTDVCAQPAVTTAEEAAEQVEKTGYYRIRLAGVPYRLYHETRLRYGWTPHPTFRDRLAAGPNEDYPFRDYPSVAWHITAPESYRREMPPGLLICIGPGPNRAPEAWLETLDELNLVYIAISAPGTPPNHYAHTMAVLAVQMMNQRYAVHPQRIYLVGLDTAGDTANTTAVLSPEVFSAAWLVNGGRFLQPLKFDGHDIQGLAPDANRDAVRAAARSTRLVFHNTKTDVDRAIYLTHARAYHQAGFRGLTVWDEQGTGDGLPSAEHLTRAIDLFDQRLHEGAERKMREAERNTKRDRLGDALSSYFAVQASAPTTEMGATAREQIKTLLATYAEQVAAIETLVTAGETRQAQRSIDQLERAWGDLADGDAARLQESARQRAREN